ncbi:MAG TPA: VOC family protein [Myxococcales bacterium]|nr:VOC family protein [Myxococcales bacterium]
MKLPSQSSAVSPHLTVRDVKAAAELYAKAFGFAIKMMLPGQGGKIMHAQLNHGLSVIMVGPEAPERGMKAPVTTGLTTPVSLFIYVDDVDATHKNALAAGLKELLPPGEQFFGARTSVLLDPDGHQWMVAQHKKDVSPDQMKEALKGRRGSPIG